MKEYVCVLYLLLLFGLFSFSEGKPCPERTRPHKSRCDVYYKCTEVKADKHVWVPSSCEEGLVYEHSLSVCVLPADDWECLIGDLKNNTLPNGNSNRDSDVYIVSNAEDDDANSSDKYEDGRVEIIIGTDINSEDKDVEAEEDGSGNGGELVGLEGFIPAQNREAEAADVPMLSERENTTIQNGDQKPEAKEELEQMLETIKTKTTTGQPSSNIDPKLTAHLQRLSQLIDGLKQTYQTQHAKPHEQHSLRPDQLNAFLAHFNIQNKFESLDPSESFVPVSSTATTKPNRTLLYKHELNTKLNPETKVVLSHSLPHHYASSSNENGNSGNGYSNSQIVVNRPEGSVHFSLPEHHYMELPQYSFENSPKISEETLKTVLELSKQMIAQQNIPKVIPSSTYFAPPIMQPILLTPHIDSPFSTNYVSQNSNSLGFSGHYTNGGSYSQNYKHKKPTKRPQHHSNSNAYMDDGSDNYEINDADTGYSQNKPGTTIIHNNVIPVHVSGTNSGEKEVLDSYGQSLGLYPPLHAERPDSNSDYHDNSHTNSGYETSFQNNKYSGSTTKRPSYVSISATSSPYVTSPRPFEFEPTPSTINQYFTPSEHLDDHNVNTVFPSVDNFGNIPRPMKGKRPNSPNHKPSQIMMASENVYGSQNHLFPQISSNKVHVRPNSLNYESFENENEDILSNYQEDNNDDETQLIRYTYGNKKQPGQQAQFTNYDDSDSQASINTVFSTNNPYMPRPSSSHHSMSSSNSYHSPGKNGKYTTSAYGEGTQLVNVGGNFIGLDVFQESILPLIGNNPASLASTLSNVEVITCVTGVRQPNSTDCTRYYVCSKKDVKVLSYSCPPYTGFNPDARICDAKTYAMCNGEPIIPNYSISENKRIQMEALKALQEAKRRQQQQQLQALNAQNMANMLQQYNNNPSSLLSISNPFSSLTPPGQDSSEQHMLNSYMQQSASMSQSFGTTPRPQLTTPTVKKRKYYCKEGDKIADQTSIYNYFVCYKNAKGQMKGHKMTCSKGLMFCPKTAMCTLPSKCS